MNLIQLTTYKRDLVSVGAVQGFDVNDIVSPIRFNSGSKSQFTLEVKNSANSYIIQVNETLDEVLAASTGLAKLEVTSINGVELATPEDMLFGTTRMVEWLSTTSGGTKFLYFEYNNPAPVIYEVSNSIEDIINFSSLSSEVTWKKVTRTYADFSTAAITVKANVYDVKAKEMIHAVHMLRTESFDSIDPGDPDADPVVPPSSIYTQYDVSCGIVADTDKYAAVVDMLPAPDGVLSTAVLTAPEVDMNAGFTIIAEATADANLNLANQGIIVFYILTSKLP